MKKLFYIVLGGHKIIKRFMKILSHMNQTEKNTNDIGKIIDDYLEKGFVVHPLKPKEKEPFTFKWSTPGVITENNCKNLFKGKKNCNIGVLCGEISKIVILDTDKLKDGEKNAVDGVKLWHKCVKKFGLPKTPICITGGGGYHIYFKYNEKTANLRGGTRVLKNSKGIGIKWDLLTTKGKDSYSYAVAPPSIHPVTNKEYRWMENTFSYEPIEMPSWLYKLLTRGLIGKPEIPKPALTFRTDVGDFSKEEVEARVNLLEITKSYEDWIKIGFYLKGCSIVLDDEEWGLDLYDQFSQKDIDKYPGFDEIEKKWNTIKGIDPASSFGSLCKMAKTDDPDEFKKLRKKSLVEDSFVYDDEGCQIRLFEKEGSDKFVYCLGTLYIYDERTGMYSLDINVLYYYLTKNKECLKLVTGTTKEGNPISTRGYGTNASLQKKVEQFVRMKSSNDDWLLQTAESSRYFLLFRDGIYDMKNNVFTKGFNPNIVFHTRVPHNFPERNEKDIEYAMELSFKSLFKNPEQTIIPLSCALAGDISVKKFYMGIGNTNRGKSGLIKMLISAFGNVIGEFNAECFAFNSKSGQDEELKLKWAVHNRYSRVLVSSETTMKKEFDGNAIKKHSSGGDTIIGRSLYGADIKFVPYYTIFLFVNDRPKIVPFDDAVEKRIEFIDFPYEFTDTPVASHHKKKKDDLNKLINETMFISGFIHILLDGYQTYLKSGLPKFDQNIREKWMEDALTKDEVKEAILDAFEITLVASDKIVASEMNGFRKNCESCRSISATRFKEILENMGVKQKKISSIFWIGIKKRKLYRTANEKDVI